jgi:hypothetical protein
MSVSDLYISRTDLPILQQEICGPILGIENPRKGIHKWDFLCSVDRKI